MTDRGTHDPSGTLPGHRPAADRAPGGPSWRPRLVVLDLDGTVVPYADGYAQPTPRVRAAVAATLAAGVPVIVATGRAVWGATGTAAALGLHGIELVCSNGAVVYDSDSGRVLHQVTVDVGLAVRELCARRSDLAFAVEHGIEGYWVTESFGADILSHVLGVVDADALVAAPTTRMVCRIVGEDTGVLPHADAAAEAVVLAAGALDPTRYSWETGYSGWIDVAAPGVSKATGVALLAADLGIDAADVLAVGDGTNDLGLFSWSGWSVAMGQAPERVRLAADEVTAEVADDGAALVLERWFG